jgi:hypothetical protein
MFTIFVLPSATLMWATAAFLPYNSIPNILWPTAMCMLMEGTPSLIKTQIKLKYLDNS